MSTKQNSTAPNVALDATDDKSSLFSNVLSHKWPTIESEDEMTDVDDDDNEYYDEYDDVDVDLNDSNNDEYYTDHDDFDVYDYDIDEADEDDEEAESDEDMDVI